MAVTRLDWDVLEPNSSRLVNLIWITGKVRSGDAYTILNELGRRFNSEVENIDKKKSWGYAKRDVRGASVISEHAAGTAVDFNAPDHWLGLSGTFTKTQVSAINRILKDLGGSVRWGGNYSGRKDEMHFELQGGVKKLAEVAAKIKGSSSKSPSVPKVTKKSNAVVAKEVLAGKWGNGNDRKNRLVKAGYNYNTIQDIVNGTSSIKKKSNSVIAREVIQGKWGNGTARSNALTKAGYNFRTIQNEVNRLL